MAKRKYITFVGVPRLNPDTGDRWFPLFVVVDREGNLKRRRHPSVFLNETRAVKACTADGDSVVAVSVNLSKAPLFIRKLAV